jgi:uncharacterized membrane protein
MFTFPTTRFLLIKTIKFLNLINNHTKRLETYNTIDAWLATFLATSAVSTTILAYFLTRRARNGTIHTTAVNEKNSLHT